jgi:hypothetical protein
MSLCEIVLVEWSCDYCSLSIIGDEALPVGWHEDLRGAHWCGCARTVDDHLRDDALELRHRSGLLEPIGRREYVDDGGDPPLIRRRTKLAFVAFPAPTLFEARGAALQVAS